MIGIVVFVILMALLAFVIVRALVTRGEEHPPPNRMLTETMLLEIDQLVADQRRVKAIKLLRDCTQLGLAEAKGRIENWDLAREQAALRGGR